MSIFQIPQALVPANFTQSFTGVRAKRTTSVSISNNTDTAVALDSEDYDTNSYHDNSTNNSRITIPSGRAGKYLIVGHFNFPSNSTGWRDVGILKNGAYVAEQRTTAINGAGTISVVSNVLDLVVNDYIQLSVYQNSGGALSSGDGAWLTATYLGA